ncbi:MAG: Nramp family divalent metal transporter [Candidatus Symbiobacter sp.]|nr:Nramp family divalent metal transporter [Candidatus Symbiobacter sp.]
MSQDKRKHKILVNWRFKILSFIGPGYIVAVGYIDPGNWATNVAAGATAGYDLLFVVMLGALIGAVLQGLVVRLATATGVDLATLIRREFPRKYWLPVWVAAEIAMIATDLAELLGVAIALNLLFRLNYSHGIIIGAVASLAMLAAGPRQKKWTEKIIGFMVGLVIFGLGYEYYLASPAVMDYLPGFLPKLDLIRNPDLLYLGLGILGATLMPHNLFLHSALASRHFVDLDAAARRRVGRWLTVDSSLALGLALIINSIILIIAAVAFKGSTPGNDVGLRDTWLLISVTLGTGGATIFALSLLAAGQSAITSCTLAGQIILDGFWQLRLPPMIRLAVTRCLALIPALAVPILWPMVSVDRLLILSQVVLSFSLPIILVPVLRLLAHPKIMADAPLPRWSLALIALLIAGLTLVNGWLVVQTIMA